MFCLFWYKTKLKVFILGKFIVSCRVLCERYMKDRSRKPHHKQLSLSSAKFCSKPTLFIAKFR